MLKNNAWTMLIRFSRGYCRFFLLAIVSAAIASLLSFVAPLIVGFAVDKVIGGKPAALPVGISQLFDALSARGNPGGDLVICALMAAICAILSGAFSYLSRVNMAKGSERLINDLRKKLFAHTQSLPFEWHTKNLTGDIIQRCTSDVETARRFVFAQLIEVLRTGIMLIIAIIIMYNYNPAMATAVIAFLPLIFGYSVYFFIRIANRFLACDEAEGQLMVAVQENLTGVRVVRAFGREQYETARFDEKNIDYTNKWIKLGGTYGSYWGIGDTIAAAQMLCVIILGAFQAAAGLLSFGELLVFISYTQMVTWPVRQLGRVLSEMSKTGVSLKRIKEIFDTPGESDPPDALKPPIDRDIEFRNVSFSYGGQPVLKNVSFTLPRGTTLGILGSTGSGKSTVTYLLNRLYDLPEDGGTITIGGVDISRINKQYLRRNIGLVLQEPFLFSKTIFDNIDIASREHNRDKLRSKARIAAIDDDIMAFAKGYDTMVGERGVTLSGGQKQRVAIARTLMMNAPVMVFDDSMSALDIETDAKIRESLRRDTRGTTVILISHRISTLMQADKIMVLRDGEAAEIGSHSELIKKDGIYKRIYDLQSDSAAAASE